MAGRWDYLPVGSLTPAQVTQLGRTQWPLTFAGSGWSVLLGIAAIVYAIYLYRGGRYGFWFLPF